MKLTIYNGSPRGEQGNSALLIKYFNTGFTTAENNSSRVYHLARTYRSEPLVDSFLQSDVVLLAFPLYTDAMPGLVKAFIESLESCCGHPGNPAIAFLIQSGFPESTHLRALEAYLVKLAKRLGCPYLGTIIRGGMEGIRNQSEDKNRPLLESFTRLGEHLGRNGQLDPQQIKELSRLERFPGWLVPMLKIAEKSGLINLGWDQMLRQNGAYARRFARPYQD